MSQNLDETEAILNKVSPSFCLAKWTSVTMHLESGLTHSCHHPTPHLVPLDELKKNYRALHNSQFKLEQRKKMMEGKRPAECDYCWRIEDLPTKQFSDRIFKSAEESSVSELDRILKNPLDINFTPKYLEVSFSNKCNFKCSYCSANFSSSWQEEIKKNGNYSTYSGQLTNTILDEDTNPYIEAFWKWWPELKTQLHTFRITGGEPLLSPNTFKILESLLEAPEKKLNISINSNLGVPDVLTDKFIGLVNRIVSEKAVHSFNLHTSVEGFGERAQYIRTGFNHDTFWKNIEKILAAPMNIQIVIMSTFNALSLTSYVDLLKKLLEINKKYRNADRLVPVFIDIAYLRYPDYQTAQVLGPEYKDEMEKIVNFIEEHQWQKTPNYEGFHDNQYYKSKRLLEWMTQGLPPAELDKQRARFYEFFSEHDRRRQMSFTQTFPELESFWQDCKKKYEQRNEVKSQTPGYFFKTGALNFLARALGRRHR